MSAINVFYFILAKKITRSSIKDNCKIRNIALYRGGYTSMNKNGFDTKEKGNITENTEEDEEG